MHLILLASLLSAAPHVNPQAEFLRGQFALSVNRPNVAISAFQSAVTADPSFAQAHNGLGIARFRAGQRAEAIAEFKAAIAADPMLAATYLNLGYALRQMSQFDDAIGAYQRYRALEPRDPDAVYGLAESYRLAGKKDEALAAFALYVKQETRSSEAKWVKKAQATIAALQSPGMQVAQASVR